MRKDTAQATAKKKRFSLHWGAGVVVEEAQIATPYHAPTIQLLKFEDGPAQGSEAIRFCVYDHRGRFQRMPCIIAAHDLPKLRAAIGEAPRLRRLLSSLAH